jgi:DNA-directed RNA polymerase subunit beta'
VDHNDLIQKNQLIVTLKSRRLQTEDIVQGIPKIEQLFEARESQSGEVLSDTVHLRLRSAFVRELELLTTEHWSTAVDKSFLEAQNFLVENIETAYSNQGVKISEKHIEVIVRQMTSRVKILEPGETGLLPGELVQHTWIKKFNQRISQVGLREATYEPIVLGISKSVLQSDSFLLAASFQEVSRVLIKSSLSKKRDFLQGLHENVIVGQGIPAGTGLVSTKLLN